MEETKPRKPRAPETKPRKPRNPETKPRKPRNPETKPRKPRKEETKARNPLYEGMTTEERKKAIHLRQYKRFGKLYLAIRTRCIKHDMKKEDFEGIDNLNDLNSVVVRVLKERGLDDKIIDQLLIKTKPNTKYSNQ